MNGNARGLIKRNMANQSFQELLDKYLTNAITESERNQLFLLIQLPKYLPELERIMDQQFITGEFEGTENDALRQLIFQKIQQKKATINIKETGRLRYINWRRIAVAAAIILFLASGYLFLINKKKEKPVTQMREQRFKNDVEPGKYKAKLTLANGSTIILNSTVLEELPKQGNTLILNKDKLLVYKTKEHSGTEILYNTLSTGHGETYAMILSDGSKVWLNSASSVKFPVAFAGKERKVEITGEAYFEIKHNDKTPFKVVVNGIEVRDLGTEFNINAYIDEVVTKTTLVSGRAMVVTGSKNRLLAPGQQVQVDGNDEMKLVSNADVEEAVAWKNGLFRFKSADVGTVMRQLARWYDVDVKYEGKIPDAHMSGIVSRDVSLKEALKMLELSDIHVRIEGMKLIVMP
jgi:transmembrane sensor